MAVHSYIAFIREPTPPRTLALSCIRKLQLSNLVAIGPSLMTNKYNYILIILLKSCTVGKRGLFIWHPGLCTVVYFSSSAAWDVICTLPLPTLCR